MLLKYKKISKSELCATSINIGIIKNSKISQLIFKSHQIKFLSSQKRAQKRSRQTMRTEKRLI